MGKLYRSHLYHADIALLRGHIDILGAVFLMEEKSLPKKHTSTYTTCKGSALELFSKIKVPSSAMDNSVG